MTQEPKQNKEGCEKCGRTSGVVDLKNCPFCHPKETGYMQEEPKQEDWRDELYTLSEKHCKHDFEDYNSCLYHIFEPFIEKLLESQKQDLIKLFKEALGEEKPKTELNLKTPNLYQFVEGYNGKRAEIIEFFRNHNINI